MSDKIIVCDEKHGDVYWRADTPEQWAASSLAILTERWNQGWWYHRPKEPAQRDTDEQNASNMTKEQIAALPRDAQLVIRRLRKRMQIQQAAYQMESEWYDRAEKCVADQDRSMVTIGRGKYAHDEPVAWQLLQDRSDYEYERVTLETLHVAEPVAITA